MAKLTLLELTNVEQMFGNTYYSMFLAETENKQIVEVGLSHNMQTRLGFNKDNPDEIIGCQVITKPYTDSRTGEIVNPEDRLNMILEGEGRVMLLNAISASIKKSDLYLAEKKDMAAAIAAKVNVELKREKKLRDQELSRERLKARALAALNPTAAKQEETLDEEPENQETTPENPEGSPEVTIEKTEELEF